MACEAELAAYNSALQVYYQAVANAEAAQSVVNSSGALVNLTWTAYQNCLNQQGESPPPTMIVAGEVKQKKKGKRG